MTMHEVINFLARFGAVYWGGEYEDDGEVITTDITFCGDCYTMSCEAPIHAEFPLDNVMIIDGISVLCEEVNHA